MSVIAFQNHSVNHSLKKFSDFLTATVQVQKHLSGGNLLIWVKMTTSLRLPLTSTSVVMVTIITTLHLRSGSWSKLTGIDSG